MPLFDMVEYTPHRSVAIYPFNSLNVTRCIPTCLSLLCSIPGTGFSRDAFSSARMSFIFYFSCLLFLYFVFPICRHSYDLAALFVPLLQGVYVPYIHQVPAMMYMNFSVLLQSIFSSPAIQLRCDRIPWFLSLPAINRHCWLDVWQFLSAVLSIPLVRLVF